MSATSTPSVFSFDPSVIPYQLQVIRDIRRNFDYSLGTHEVLLSGSVGSSKSTVLAHVAVTHCLMYRGARFMIGRLSMPALRSTLFHKILEHLGEDLIEGKDYTVNLTTASIKFRNGSEIISRSWADRKYFKVRSLELSGVAIDETSENDDIEFYNEIKMRVGRLPHVKENIIIHATNPGSPESWLYKYFSIGDSTKRLSTRHVYYSVTTDNPFLPPQYIEQLKKDLDPKLARRMIYGEWIELTGEVIYSEYNSEVQYKRGVSYEPRSDYPIILTFDFNSGLEKPMSMLLLQYIDDHFHAFDEIVLPNAKTTDVLDELFEREYFARFSNFIICGDASGTHKDTRSLRSDYEIIRSFLNRAAKHYEYCVPLSNPPIRARHNAVNAYCKNAAGEVRLTLYSKCKVLDEGLRLTKLKKGANYVEDDSTFSQHITTSLGYAVCFLSKKHARKSQGTTIL